MEIIFLIVLFLIIGGYFIYPIFIWILSLFFEKKYFLNATNKPSISIIISAYNEEVVIEDTIRNFINLGYPLEKMEIIIGSDCSTDRTNEIIKNLENEYKGIVKAVVFENRRGKSAVLNDLVKIAKNEILIFSDANTMYQKNALDEIVKFYDDPKVGGVCGRLLLLDNEEAIKVGNQEKKYWDIESWIKNNEGNLGILIGANGGIYSVRKEYFVPIPNDKLITDDLFISLKILSFKKDFVYEKKAVAIEYTAPSLDIEYKRKVRICSSNLNTLKYLYELLSPKYGIIAPAFFFHKIIRWISPILLLILFISNLFIYDKNLFYTIFFLSQLFFYFLSLIGWAFNKMGINITFFNLPFFFVLTNFAFMHGFVKLVAGINAGYWQSTTRVRFKQN